MPRPMRIQPRDIGWLAELGECGVEDKNMIHSRHYHTQCDRVIRRRLAQLESNGLIQRLRISEFHAHHQPGRLPSIFVLTDKGADVVYRYSGKRPKPVSPNLSPFTVRHRIEVARLQLAVLDAAKHHELEKPRWINEWATIPNSKRGDSFARRFVLYESFDTVPGESLSCRPDAACRLDYRGVNLLAYWERDRSTETIAQVARKIPGFAALSQSRRFEQHFPGVTRPVFRVYFVCESEARIGNIRQAIQKHQGAELFRFAQADRLQPDRLLSSDDVWQNVEGEFAPLLRGVNGTPVTVGAINA